MPFTDRISLARSEQPIAREYNQFLFNTAYNPLYLRNTALSPLKEATIVQIMPYIFQICIYLYSACSNGQYTIHRRKQRPFQDACSSQKLVGIQQSCLKFQSCFHVQGNTLKAKYKRCMQKVQIPVQLTCLSFE